MCSMWCMSSSLWIISSCSLTRGLLILLSIEYELLVSSTEPMGEICDLRSTFDTIWSWLAYLSDIVIVNSSLLWIDSSSVRTSTLSTCFNYLLSTSSLCSLNDCQSELCIFKSERLIKLSFNFSVGWCRNLDVGLVALFVVSLRRSF